MTPDPDADAAAAAAAPFRHRYRVRFDEAGADERLRTSGLLRYAQDVAWIHADALGFDRAWNESRGLLWLVRAAELEVVAPIPMGTEIEVTTTVVGYRRVWARRRAEVSLPDGSLAAWIHTDWVMLDRRGSPTRIPDVFGAAFTSRPAQIALIRVDPGPADAAAGERRFRVRPHEVDPNAHPNNAAYVDWLEEGILDLGGSVDSLPRRYRLEYAAAAEPRAHLVAVTWRDGSAWSHRLSAAGGGELFRAQVEG